MRASSRSRCRRRSGWPRSSTTWWSATRASTASALARLAADERARVPGHADDRQRRAARADRVRRSVPTGPPIRVCVELDASLRLAGGRVHLGARRSPTHAPEDAAALARTIVAHPRFELVGLMAYEGQIAGRRRQPARAAEVRRPRDAAAVRPSSSAERRAAAVAAVREVAPLEFVNGGGTGSIETTAAEEAVTEIAAGSGLFGPRALRPLHQVPPAAGRPLRAVRRTTPLATSTPPSSAGAGSPPAPAGPDRLPTPVWPQGLELRAGRGRRRGADPADRGRGSRSCGSATGCGSGTPRPASSCEHVDELHLIADGQVVGTAPTYRGEGKVFL